MIKRLFLFAVLIGAGLTVGLGFYAFDQLNKPLALDEPTVYQVERGASLRRVLTDFEQVGWLDEARIPEYWLRYHETTRIQRGEYQVRPGETAVQVIERMVDGDKILRTVQFIEGWTFTQFRQAIEANEFLTQTLTGLSDEAVLDRLELEIDHPEGWFFPDTYHFERGRTDADLLLQAHRKMRDELERAWQNRADELVIDTPFEALILASIVEKETGAAYERPQIAGVFSRRLEQGMRLQTDPTVIYGLGDTYDGNLTRADLRRDTPYNTYTRAGLPPTPIANPGRGALEAVVDPAPGSALFFVAKGDGTHIFSDTYEEHDAAVRQFQRFQRREDYRSAPDEPPVDEETQP